MNISESPLPASTGATSTRAVAGKLSGLVVAGFAGDEGQSVRRGDGGVLCQPPVPPYPYPWGSKIVDSWAIPWPSDRLKKSSDCPEAASETRLRLQVSSGCSLSAPEAVSTPLFLAGPLAAGIGD